METFEVDAAEVERAVVASGLFDAVDGEARASLIAAFTGVRLVTGEFLIRFGDPADGLFIVRHGRLQVSSNDAGGDVLGHFGRGEVVGEMGVLTDQPRSAAVRAMRDTDVFRLPSEAFTNLLQRHPELLRPFASIVVERVRSSRSGVHRDSLPSSVALVDVGGADVARLARSIADHLPGRSVRVVDSDDAPAVGERTAWLLDLESNADLVLLVTDPTPTPWTRRCLRHADRAVLVGDADHPAARGAVECDAEVVERLAHLPQHLIVTHRGRPGASRWLVDRGSMRWTNVDLDDPAQVGRAAREIGGRTNIAVLSGGGARGFAHFGVFRAFAERGVPIDGIVGASAGAVVGALLARLGDPADAQHQMLDWFSRTQWRRDLTLPTVALTTGRLMTEGLRELGADALIEDLPIEFAAVSCDLVAARPVVHDRGPVWLAIRASGSVPGLFPPVRVDGQLLVDGGLVANMPSELARARHPNARLIAVDVGSPGGIGTDGVDGSGIANGWARLRQRDAGVGMMRLLARLTELGRNDSSEAADTVVRPDVTEFGLLDSASAHAIADRGYEAGLAAIERCAELRCAIGG